MKILVTVKRVSDPDMKIKVKSDGSGIEMESISYKVNPMDEIAVEEAVCIKEEFGGEIVVVHVGNENARVEIKSCLAMGCDRGVLVLVEKEQDADQITRILLEIVKKESPDLVLMGKQAVDVDDCQVPQMLAERLNWAQACFASKVEIQRETATVHREVDGGIEIVEIDLPGIISADLRLNEPRYPALPAIMKAEQMDIEKITLSELGIEPAPKVLVKQLSNPPLRNKGRIVEDVQEMLEGLQDKGLIA